MTEKGIMEPERLRKVLRRCEQQGYISTEDWRRLVIQFLGEKGRYPYGEQPEETKKIFNRLFRMHPTGLRIRMKIPATVMKLLPVTTKWSEDEGLQMQPDSEPESKLEEKIAKILKKKMAERWQNGKEEKE